MYCALWSAFWSTPFRVQVGKQARLWGNLRYRNIIHILDSSPRCSLHPWIPDLPASHPNSYCCCYGMIRRPSSRQAMGVAPKSPIQRSRIPCDAPGQKQHLRAMLGAPAAKPLGCVPDTRRRSATQPAASPPRSSRSSSRSWRTAYYFREDTLEPRTASIP